jgi:ABC-type multidrug transport system ATPase subunit
MGECVAVVGPTGAGKTTLISLLKRFYDPHAGRIALDGVDIRTITLKSLRDQISVVLQTPQLFSGTISENIRYGRLSATREDVIEAAKAANAHDFVVGLPDGYDTELGENGAQLSGGERQRICVARSFLKDAPILILDEPTSSIDSKTEAVILDALDELMVGRTTFMIAHRLSTVRHADKILVISQGEIAQQGVHEDLLMQDGLYKELYDAQHRPRGRAVEDRAPQDGADKTSAVAAAIGEGAGEANGTLPPTRRVARAPRSSSGIIPRVVWALRETGRSWNSAWQEAAEFNGNGDGRRHHDSDGNGATPADGDPAAPNVGDLVER